MTCEMGVEGVHEDHCLHDLPRKALHAPGKVCCWCGDIFCSDYEPSASHGEYEPGISKREAVSRSKALEGTLCTCSYEESEEMTRHAPLCAMKE